MMFHIHNLDFTTSLRAGDVVIVKPEGEKPFLALFTESNHFFAEDRTVHKIESGKIVLLGHEAKRTDRAIETLARFRQEKLIESIFVVAELQAELAELRRLVEIHLGHSDIHQPHR